MKYQYARTLAVVKELAMGKRLTLSNGVVIAMGEDMTIGYLVTIDGEDHIFGLSEMTLAQLNRILEQEGVMIIPREHTMKSDLEKFLDEIAEELRRIEEMEEKQSVEVIIGAIPEFCERCGVVTPDKHPSANPQTRKHEWVCLDCLLKEIEEDDN